MPTLRFPPPLLDFRTSPHQSTALLFSPKPFSFSPKKSEDSVLTHIHCPESWKWRARVSSFSDKSRGIESLKQIFYRLLRRLTVAPPPLPRINSESNWWVVDRIVGKLESMNKVKEPLKSSLLNGKWELLYTTSKSILQNERPKFLRPNGKIYQAINVDTLRAQNMETWPFFNQATANLVPLNERRVAVKFDSFKIAALIPIKARGSGRGQLEITYLDEELRVSRGNQGNLFILRMADPNYRVPL